MPVLSRRTGQKVLLTCVGASVRVPPCEGAAVRLGIEAPPGATVLREESQRQTAPASPPPRPAAGGVPLSAVWERLRDTAVGLGMARLLLDAGQVGDAREALARLSEDLQVLRRGLRGEPEEARDASPPAGRLAHKALLVEDDRGTRGFALRPAEVSGWFPEPFDPASLLRDLREVLACRA